MNMMIDMMVFFMFSEIQAKAIFDTLWRIEAGARTG
jgi:hypothetical protein